MSTHNYFVQQLIRKGMAAAQAEVRAQIMLAEDVFGVGFKRDRQGNPIERGIGSEQQPTETHFRAIEKYEGKEAADKARTAASERHNANSRPESVRPVKRRRRAQPRRPTVRPGEGGDGGGA